MTQHSTSPEQFADEFNSKVIGAYRQITVEDVRDLVDCGLIFRYGCFLRDDLQTIIGILNYEQLRQNRQHRQEIRGTDGAMDCRRCGVVLANPKGKRGRPHEYCSDCEPYRGRERYRKRRSRMRGTVS